MKNGKYKLFDVQKSVKKIEQLSCDNIKTANVLELQDALYKINQEAHETIHNIEIYGLH